MTVYMDVVVLLNFLVDFLLLLGTNRLCGYPPGWGRSALAAGAGSIYAGICLLPELHFLGNTLWRIAALAVLSCIAFGVSKSAVRRGAVFVLLSMALGGIAMGIGGGGFWELAGAAAGICILCAVGFREKIGSVSYVPVELSYGGKRVQLTALQDTGNTLTDPITGRRVLVVGADIAWKLMGLTQQELRTPLKTMTQGKVPGLRLIPYRTVGQPAALLLALRLPWVKIGNWTGSSLVAFAPEGLSREGAYQALTGGSL